MFGGDKENSALQNMSEEDMKQHLFDKMSSAGITNGLKAEMRTRLYNQLKAQSKGDIHGSRGVATQLKNLPNALSYKLVVSLVADFMTKCDLDYSKSIFLPESGFAQEILNKEEIAEVLKI